MAFDWAAVHAKKLADYQGLNATPVTFTKTVPGAPNSSTGAWSGSPTTVSVTGYAVRAVKGDPDAYARLNLSMTEAPTLDFVPSTMGQSPVQGMDVAFGDDTYVVEQVFPFAPAGQLISAHVIVRRN